MVENTIEHRSRHAGVKLISQFVAHLDPGSVPALPRLYYRQASAPEGFTMGPVLNRSAGRIDTVLFTRPGPFV
jgi:hypothetical protein